MTADDKKKTKTLLTPFGEIKILIDGKPIPYVAQRGKKLEGMCLHVLRRYQIAIHFTPDGENHTLACVFETGLSYTTSASELGAERRAASHCNAVGLAGPAFPLDARTYDPNGVGAPRRGAHPGRPGGKKTGPQS